ncbi:MAG: hypothetical protein QOF51_4298 [Chloroflexota bacterium]|jgi:RNA polymerase sigma-70 factor (ECF subfamily)|nr:hypothetical protein [Chloroflexota bacterium]
MDLGGRTDEGSGTDEELSKRFREGDVQAFEAIVERYSRSIYNFTLRFLGDSADAEDATQLTFVQAFESYPRAKAEAPIRPWLFQVARNKCIDLIRRRRTISLSSMERDDDEGPAFDPPDEDRLPDEIFMHTELQQLLQDAILTLPLRSREVVTMRYQGELTFAEIGDALGMPENTAKTLFQRAKVRLRGYLRKRI